MEAGPVVKALICRLVGHTVDALTGACHRCRAHVLDPIKGAPPRPTEGDPMTALVAARSGRAPIWPPTAHDARDTEDGSVEHRALFTVKEIDG